MLYQVRFPVKDDFIACVCLPNNHYWNYVFLTKGIVEKCIEVRQAYEIYKQPEHYSKLMENSICRPPLSWNIDESCMCIICIPIFISKHNIKLTSSPIKPLTFKLNPEHLNKPVQCSNKNRKFFSGAGTVFWGGIGIHWKQDLSLYKGSQVPGSLPKITLC